MTLMPICLLKILDGKNKTVNKSLNFCNLLNPDNSQSLFNYRNNVTKYILRDTEGKLTTPMPRTNYLNNCFGYSGAVLWKNLQFM
jgi:hypothetical protein